MFSPAGWSSVIASFSFSDEFRRFRSVTLILSFSVRLVLIFSMLVSECESALSGAVRPEKVFAERLELGESEIQFGVFVGESIEILGGVLKVFHGVGCFVGNRFDDLQHFRRGLAEIGCPSPAKVSPFPARPTLVCPG